MTASKNLELPRGLTPRLLSREQAAAYCGMSPNHFEEHCPVPAMSFGKRRLYDIQALDRWLDERSGLVGPLRAVDEWLGALDGDKGEGR